MDLVHRPIGAERIQVDLQQFFTQGFRVFGAGLPEERGYIVIDRAATAALEVDEIRLPVHQHYVPGVEIPV